MVVVISASGASLPAHAKDAGDITGNANSTPPRVILLSESVDGTQVSLQTGTVTWNIVFGSLDWTPASKAAFEAALPIWGAVINATVTLQIHARWFFTAPEVLGRPFQGNYQNGFPNQPVANTYYPAPLARTLGGPTVLPTGDHITLEFNTYHHDEGNFYYGFDSNPSATQYDFITVAVREIGRAMGIRSSFQADTPSNGQGTYGYQNTGLPFIYDRFLANGTQNLIQTYANGSTALGTALETSDNMFFRGPSGDVRLHNPTDFFNSGRNLWYFNDATYPPGDADANMTNTFVTGPSDANHSIGPKTKGVLADIGWPIVGLGPSNPLPVLTSISPASTSAGSPEFVLTANGSGFVAQSKVQWNGSDLATTFMTANQLTAVVPASLIASAGSANVTVVSPAPGGGTSATKTFTITGANNPAPALTSISPTTAAAGSPQLTLTADGSGFVAQSKVQWNGSDLATTFVTANQLTAVVPAPHVASAGSANVTVVSPAPGGGTSATKTFTITSGSNPAPAPVLTSISPTSKTAGSALFTLTATGTGFAASSIVRWGSTDLSTSFVSTTSLTATVPAALVASTGSAQVTVFTSAPGGGTSAAQTFTITPPTSGGGTISGKKFNDLDGDGQPAEAGEPGVAGFTIQVLNSDGGVVAQQTTDAQGAYEFTGLGAGNYTVAESGKGGWRQTFPAVLTERVSVTSAGVQAVPGTGNQASGGPSISSDGRYVAFSSSATNFAANDQKSVPDIFVYDRQTDTVQQVNVTSAGVPASGGGSDDAVISGNGRFVAYSSTAPNLVSPDFSGTRDIFIFDRQTSTTERASFGLAGAQPAFGAETPAISAAGEFVAFASLSNNLVAGDTNSSTDVFVWNNQTNATERVSLSSAGQQGNGSSSAPSISANGQFVAFESSATNFGPGVTSSGVFVRDRTANTTELISATGFQASISANGRFVGFISEATNLVPGDTNGRADVFVHDRQTKTTERVSVDSSGNQQLNGSVTRPSLSADGRLVAFASDAKNLIAGDTNTGYDVFVFDRQTRIQERVSVNTQGNQQTCPAGTCSSTHSISADGRSIAFNSPATDLVPNDTNAAVDTFVRVLSGVHSVALTTGQVVQNQNFGNTRTCSLDVTTTNDALSPSDSVNTLREAIICANSVPGADTIVLPAGTYTMNPSSGDDVALQGDLDITSDLTITGAGAATTIIQGCAAPCTANDRVFDVIGSISVTISGVTIQHGDAFGENDDTGGAIRQRSDDGLLQITNSIIQDNDAQTDGGGISVNANLFVTDTIIRNNRASLSGGVYICSGSSQTATFNRVTISGNAADGASGGGEGGGIWLECGLSLTITNSTINGNTSTGDGGGINSEKQLTIINSTISGNSADGSAGGIRNSGGPVTLTNITITGNTADNDNDGSGNGGGIATSSGVLNFINTILGGNTDKGGQAPECSGTLTSGGHNLIKSATGCTIAGVTTGNLTGQDPALGALSSNGGPTATHLPTAGSPAINGGDDAVVGAPLSLTTDQRGTGFARKNGVHVDIGAVEAPAPAAVEFDVDCNGVLNATDVVAILHVVAALTSSPQPVSPCTANANGDGTTDLQDAVTALRRIAGL
ncbi:hypothetical protein AYO38_00675 [bacterium SCGC AG-212-C10]|nr:hypothetical protein AYO38_00675 [bacterium SCGC AG-212-C10]